MEDAVEHGGDEQAAGRSPEADWAPGGKKGSPHRSSNTDRKRALASQRGERETDEGQPETAAHESGQHHREAEHEDAVRHHPGRSKQVVHGVGRCRDSAECESIRPHFESKAGQSDVHGDQDERDARDRSDPVKGVKRHIRDVVGHSDEPVHRESLCVCTQNVGVGQAGRGTRNHFVRVHVGRELAADALLPRRPALNCGDESGPEHEHDEMRPVGSAPPSRVRSASAAESTEAPGTLPPVASPEATDRARAEALPRRMGAFELVARRGWTAILLAVFVALPLAWIVRRSLAGYGTVPLPVDLKVFLNAADDILAGRNPFPDSPALTGDANYVYPPLLAIVATPLAVLPVASAVLIWSLLSAGAIAAALWLLGVRDWRVYGLSLLLAGTRDSIAAGTVGPLLVLGAAIAWRYRDRRPALAGAGAGLAIALKLFVWPLLLWLVVTRRAHTALLGVIIGGGAALASWAVIGFDGLTDYPNLLRRLSDLEADQSYSMYAVGQAVGLASPLAVGFSLAVGAIFLAVMVSTARDVAIPAAERDRRALTAAIAASLALDAYSLDPLPRPADRPPGAGEAAHRAALARGARSRCRQDRRLVACRLAERRSGLAGRGSGDDLSVLALMLRSTHCEAAAPSPRGDRSDSATR